jgi:hypothetical protein
MNHVVIYNLRRKHRALDEAIRQEARGLAPDHLRLQTLKRRKMALKDEIAMREAGLAPLRF